MKSQIHSFVKLTTSCQEYEKIRLTQSLHLYEHKITLNWVDKISARASAVRKLITRDLCSNNLSTSEKNIKTYRIFVVMKLYDIITQL